MVNGIGISFPDCSALILTVPLDKYACEDEYPRTHIYRVGLLSCTNLRAPVEVAQVALILVVQVGPD